MILEEKTRGSVVLLSITGEYDTLDVDRFSAAVTALVARGSVLVALSLEKLSFINSTALGSLIRERERLTQAGGDLACAALSRFTEKNFKLLGLDKRIRCFATVDEAVAYLEGFGKAGVAVGREQRVAFRFADESLTGKERRAEILEVREDGLTFRLDNLEGLDPDASFPAGRELELRFGLELAHPTHEFRAKAKVEGSESWVGRRVVIRAAFAGMARGEKEALGRFVKDLRYIRGETGGGAREP